ncbi:MMPL family transporter [Candidatus Thioglobus autotrophicus]|uniref:efflux RND transporter permease subunit n=1 Tax=Candidatus Thioglobus autotrophicus TaxID=1705394 RepID=UPI00299F1708|nr:MMPL family transporter [Candidatus Thioglobus autotrophicus]WPE17190.1 MMPL family transporter [Candidatus Thioglobus autotrophicus]
MNNFAKRYAAFAIANRKLILALMAFFTLFMGYFIQDLDIRNDPDTLLPETNRYVATNAYGEQKFGFGNIMVVGFVLKDCVGGNDPYSDADEIINFDPETGLRINESAPVKMTQNICEAAGGAWEDSADVYQPWFVNMVQKAHNDMVALKHSRDNNFMDIAAQKIKYMGTSEDGGLKFERLIPVAGINITDKQVADTQLAHLKKGIETNPVLAPMLMLKQAKDGTRCEFAQEGWYDDETCKAKGFFIVGDYADTVKSDYLPWVTSTIALVDAIKAEHGDRVEVRIAGEPYFLAFMLYDLVQKWWLFAISFLIVVAMLWYLNKGWRGSVFPLIGVVATIIITLGLMGFTAYKLTTMMVLTPMLLLAIGTGHAVQVVRRYQSELHTNAILPMSAAERAIAATIVPATLAIVTDMVGFFTLSFVDISFYKAYAYFGMFGMMTILITTTTIAPILMAMFPGKNTQVDASMVEASKFEKGMAKTLTSVIMGKMKIIPIGMVVALVAWSAVQTKVFEPTVDSPMPGVEVGINYSRAAFKYDSDANIDLRRLGEVMPGVISVNIPIKGKVANFPMLPACSYDGSQAPGTPCWDEDEDAPQGAFNNAEVMAAIEKTEDWMRSHPNIGFTGSYIQFLKIVNMLMMTPEGQEPDLKYFHVPNAEFIAKNMDVYGDTEDPEWMPDANEIVTGFNGLLEANTNAGDLDSFVAKGWNEGVIMGFVNTMDPVKTHQTVKDIQQWFVDNKDEPGFDLVTWGFKSGDVVHMPESGKTVQIEDSGTNTIAVGGFLGATEATHDVAEVEYIKSPLVTALAIFIIAALIFGSPLIAAILTSTLLVTLFGQYGLGAYFTSVENWSGNLHFATLVSLSIAMGLGVDYGIYMISRLREEMQATAGNWAQSLSNTLETTGAAVFASIVVLLASFIPLLMTQLANTWALGIFISEALIIDVVIALTIIPLLVYIFKPKYVFGDKK